MQAATKILLRSCFSFSALSTSIFRPLHCMTQVVGISTISTSTQHSPFARQLLSSTSFCRDQQLRLLKHSASRLYGKRNQIFTFLGLTVATNFSARWNGAVHCERDERRERDQLGGVIAQGAGEDEYLVLGTQHYKVLEYIKRLWWPTVFVITVFVGYPYPMSLLLNCILLMWSTKPCPASIYLWVEKRRQNQANGRCTLNLLKDKLNPSAAVMHVEVGDYILFSLAKVSSLTQNTTMVGLLGDWWIICSSSSRITAVGLNIDKMPNLDALAKEFRYKKAELEAEGRRVVEDGVKKYKAWCEKV